MKRRYKNAGSSLVDADFIAEMIAVNATETQNHVRLRYSR